MINGILISLSIDPFDYRKTFLVAAKQRIDRSEGIPRATDMAGALSQTFVDVYKTAAAEFGFGPSQHKERPSLPPGIRKDDVDVMSLDLNGATQPKSIWEACKLGQVQHVVDFVQKEGSTILSRLDEAGHSPAHWACLTGQAKVLQFIIQQGEFYNICSSHELGQYPIHWAVINGHISCIELLLQVGVDIDIRDAKAATPLIVACQYGQTVMAGFLMGKGAKLNVSDAEGDTALHWAAFKGQPDLMRLLVYSGFNAHQKDNFGQTPLHLASISGNLNCVRDLCQVDKAEINVYDRNGKTPLMLAAGRRHEDIERYLKEEIRSRTSLLGSTFKLKHLVFGPPGKSRSAMLFFMCNLVLWGYPMYAMRAVPLTYEHYPHLHHAFIFCNIIMWICFYHCNMKDPGYLPRNVPEYDQIIRSSGQNLQAESSTGIFLENPLSRLCHTCRTVRPLRAKHCKVCDRCVKEMDHHCPYIYNCVGRNNRHWFGFFTLMCFIIGIFTYTFGYLLISQAGFDIIVISGLFLASLAVIVGLLVSSCVWYHAAINLTTNESMNYKRYKYLQDKNGKFRNPFNRGILTNCLEFFHFKDSYVESESKAAKTYPFHV